MNEKSKFKETKYFAKLYKELAALDTCTARSFLTLFNASSNVSLWNSMGFSSFIPSEDVCMGNVCVYEKSSAHPSKDLMLPMLPLQYYMSAELFPVHPRCM